MKSNKTSTSLSKATWKQLCRIKRDHYDIGDFCILTDSYNVWLSEQKLGQPTSQQIEIPRKVFNKLIAFYLKE